MQAQYTKLQKPFSNCLLYFRYSFDDGRVLDESNQEFATQPYNTLTPKPVTRYRMNASQDIQKSLMSKNMSIFSIFFEGLKLFWKLYGLFNNYDWFTIFMNQQPGLSKLPSTLPIQYNSNSTERYNETETFDPEKGQQMPLNNRRNERDINSKDTETDRKSISDAKYIKGDPLKGYYDFVITEGSYKFWAVFQVNQIFYC